MVERLGGVIIDHKTQTVDLTIFSEYDMVFDKQSLDNLIELLGRAKRILNSGPLPDMDWSVPV